MPSLAASVLLAYPSDFAIEVLVPNASQFDTQAYIEQGGPGSYIKIRDALFFEELVPIEVLVHASVDSRTFDALLSRTEITITANATSAAPPPRILRGTTDVANPADNRPTKVQLDSVTLDSTSAVQVESSSGEKSTHYAVFKADLFLRYPALKLHKPVVHFSASATLKPPTLSDGPSAPDSDYLPSGLPEPENLLANMVQSMKPALPAGHVLNLPASRLVKVAPRASPPNTDIRPLRTFSKLIPILPLLVVRVGCSTANRMPEPVATLDIELTRYVTCSADINKVEVRATQLHAECLTANLESSLTLYPGDRSSLVYKLLQDSNSGSNAAASSHSDHVLEVDIISTAHLTESCRPRLKIQWRGNVSPFFAKPPNQHHRQQQRPNSSSARPSQDMALTSRPVSKHLSMTGRPLSAALSSDTGVTFTFSAPPTPVLNGETFHLDIFIVNRSFRRKRLAVIAVPHAARNPQSSSFGLRPFTADSNAAGWRHDTAEAVAESKSLFLQQRKRERDAAEVVCLNADVRIGPLPPGTCHNVHLEFLAVSRGFVNLSAVHIVDLETREATEVTDLPAIEVVDAYGEGEEM